MTVEPWARVKEILYAALELDVERCSSYLHQACAGDLSLRQEVDSLIVSQSDIDEHFLEGLPRRLIDGGSMRSLVGRSIDPYRIVEELALEAWAMSIAPWAPTFVERDWVASQEFATGRLDSDFLRGSGIDRSAAFVGSVRPWGTS